MEQVRAPGLSTQEKTQILEADKSVESAASAEKQLDRAIELNPKAFAGPLAGAKTMADRVFPGEWGGTASTEYENIIGRQVLDTISTFTNPTEGERDFAIRLQASLNKSAPEREVLLKEGKKIIAERKAKEGARAEALRSGTYYEPRSGSGGGGPPSPGSSDLKGLSDDDLLKMLGAK